jgi:glycosyltransferase involved in cell wall biosynthesis
VVAIAQAAYNTLTEVSFIVPAFNEEALLAATLRAIREAAATIQESYEVIVVDDASTDNTTGVAESFGAKVIPVSCRHIAATRNAGAREARGDWLIFVDADTLVTPAVVQEAVSALRAGAVGGGCQVHFEGRLPLYGRLLVALVAPLYRGIGLAAGCFLFCTRSAFQAVGGFDETLYAAEEIFLSRALRRQGRFVVLREQVSTSGRKLRAHSGRETLGTLLHLAFGGRKAMAQRKGLEIWYGKRRKDPG